MVEMLLASCGAEIKFHKWPSGDYHGAFRIPEAGFYVPNISWSCDGKFLATTTPSLGPPLILTVNQIAQAHLVIDLQQVKTLAFSRIIQQHIILGTDTGQVFLYDIQAQNTIKQFPSLPSSVKYLQYSAKDASLAAGCKNGQICLFNKECDICATFYVPNCSNLTAMDFHSQQPHILAAAGGDGIVTVWNSDRGCTNIVEKKHNNFITDLAFSTGNDLVTVGLDQKFNGYDLRIMKSTFSYTTDSQLTAVSFAPSDDKIVVASIDGKIYCYDKRRISYPIHTIIAHHPKAIGQIAFQMVEESKSAPDTVLECVLSNVNFIKVIDSPLQSQIPASGDCSMYLENFELPNQINYFNKAYCMYDSVKSSTKNNDSTTDCLCVTRHTGCTNFLTKKNADKIKNDTICQCAKELPSCSCPNNNSSDDEFAIMNKYFTDIITDMVDKLIDLFNKELLRIRMALSKGFIHMECKMNTRWDKFNATLLECAGSEFIHERIRDKLLNNINISNEVDGIGNEVKE